MCFFLVGVFLCLCCFFWLCSTNIKARIFHIISFASMFAPIWNVIYGAVFLIVVLITFAIYCDDKDEVFDFVNNIHIVRFKPFYRFMMGMKFEGDV